MGGHTYSEQDGKDTRSDDDGCLNDKFEGSPTCEEYASICTDGTHGDEEHISSRLLRIKSKIQECCPKTCGRSPTIMPPSSFAADSLTTVDRNRLYALFARSGKHDEPIAK